jgi:uncharacterized protein with von Willebrand factor type A (vWA) domain
VAESAFVDLFVAFGNELRAEGIAVGSGDVMTYCSAMATLDPADLVDLYWAGRTTLVIRRDQIPVYDRAFRRFFLDEHEALPEPWKSTLPPAADSQAVLEVPATEPGRDGEDDAGPTRAGRPTSRSSAQGLPHRREPRLRRIITRIRWAS